MRVAGTVTILAGLLALSCTVAQADSHADLAQQLTNPIANIVTIPIQMNFDYNLGLNDEGTKITTNIQPVVPFDIGEDWILITRTIMPVIYQNKVFPGTGSQFGLGDILAQFYFSPKKPTSGGLIWGAGPVLLMPTATDSLLGGRKWAAGPAGVALVFRGPWTLGGLANHVWSFAGEKDRADISNTFLQPFAAYTWPSEWIVSLQTESTYNWEIEKWSVPLNMAAAKLVRIGKLSVSLQAGVGYWLTTPAAGPEGFRFRFQANIVLPK